MDGPTRNLAPKSRPPKNDGKCHEINAGWGIGSSEEISAAKGNAEPRYQTLILNTNTNRQWNS
jgi:hypothetical protein